MNEGRAGVVTTVVVLLALLNLGVGAWMLVSPSSFAEFVAFADHPHYSHDLGALQLGLGLGLLLALVWADSLVTVLTGFLAANTIHVVNHVVDLDHGGSPAQAWALGVLSVLAAVALALRVRRLGGVLGRVGVATDPELVPFVRQKTISITTFRKDGTGGRSPVSIAVEGDHAYVRSFERSVKSRRLRRSPEAEIAASDWAGRHVTAAVVPARMRLLAGAEHRHAAAVLRRKYPLLHGVVVPLAHRLGRGRYGRTVHFELTVRRPGQATLP